MIENERKYKISTKNFQSNERSVQHDFSTLTEMAIIIARIETWPLLNVHKQMANGKDDECNCISFARLCMCVRFCSSYLSIFFIMMGLANFQYTFINLLTPLDDLRSYFPGDVNPKPYAHNANKPNLLITF